MFKEFFPYGRYRFIFGKIRYGATYVFEFHIELVFGQIFEYRAAQHISGNIILVVSIDRNAGIEAVRFFVVKIPQSHLFRRHGRYHTRCHHFFYLYIVETDKILYHFIFIRLENTFFLTHRKHGRYFFPAHRNLFFFG